MQERWCPECGTKLIKLGEGCVGSNTFFGSAESKYGYFYICGPCKALLFITTKAYQTLIAQIGTLDEEFLTHLLSSSL